MVQTIKKAPTSSPSSAKSASEPSGNAFKIASSNRDSVEKVAQISTRAAKDLYESGRSQAREVHSKVYEMSKESAEQFSKSADVFTKAMYEAVSSSRDNVEACIESSNSAANFARDYSEEAFEYANQCFSDCIELSKEAFACRTMNDAIELQNRCFKQAMDSFFDQSSKLSSMWFEFSAEATEPFNERVASASEQFSKIANQ